MSKYEKAQGRGQSLSELVRQLGAHERAFRKLLASHDCDLQRPLTFNEFRALCRDSGVIMKQGPLSLLFTHLEEPSTASVTLGDLEQFLADHTGDMEASRGGFGTPPTTGGGDGASRVAFAGTSRHDRGRHGSITGGPGCASGSMSRSMNRDMQQAQDDACQRDEYDNHNGGAAGGSTMRGKAKAWLTSRPPRGNWKYDEVPRVHYPPALTTYR